MQKEKNMENLMKDRQKEYSPEKAAEIIIRGMIRNKREILVGKSELMMLHIRRYLPWLFFRIADKIKSLKLNELNFNNLIINLTL